MAITRQLTTLYDRLYQAYGPQHWWPGETPFEVMVGAVLTQNTSWKNVERAIANLREADALTLQAVSAMPEGDLAMLIRPSGFFNVKARRLKNLCRWLETQGGIEPLGELQTGPLRTALLTVNGIGPETTDDILLYVFERPVFVIDTYTRRLLKRLQLINGRENYEQLRALFEQSLAPDPGLFNEYHALIVRHAKEPCRGATDCRHCRVEEPL